MVCFQTKYPNLVNFWKDHAMENLGIFYDHLDYFRAIVIFLWQFGIFCGNLVYFSPFWYFGPRKIWQPWLETGRPDELVKKSPNTYVAQNPLT
jgi:hypothetical protein